MVRVSAYFTHLQFGEMRGFEGVTSEGLGWATSGAQEQSPCEGVLQRSPLEVGVWRLCPQLGPGA